MACFFFIIMDLRTIADRFVEIGERFPGPYIDSGMPCFGRDFTGISANLGAGEVYNTQDSAYQLVLSISMADHPVIADVLGLPKYDGDDESIARVVGRMTEEKILDGVRILDLGCGLIPTFARSARRLGADVYTVDVILPTAFEYSRELFPEDARDAEQKDHFAIDLNQRNAGKKIAKKFGSDFDLVTSAYIEEGAHFGCGIEAHFYGGSGFAKQFLGQNGVYFGTHASGILVQGNQFVKTELGKVTSD